MYVGAVFPWVILVLGSVLILRSLSGSGLGSRGLMVPGTTLVMMAGVNLLWTVSTALSVGLIAAMIVLSLIVRARIPKRPILQDAGFILAGIITACVLILELVPDLSAFMVKTLLLTTATLGVMFLGWIVLVLVRRMQAA